MERLEHFLVAICVIVVLAVFLPQYIHLQDKEVLLLYLSLVFFSAILTPDIDIKLPFVSHRGITHNPLGIIVIAVLGWLSTNLALAYIGQQALTAFTPYIWGGLVAGWYLHIGTDYVYDRFRNTTWIVLMIIMGIVWWLA